MKSAIHGTGLKAVGKELQKLVKEIMTNSVTECNYCLISLQFCL